MELNLEKGRLTSTNVDLNLTDLTVNLIRALNRTQDKQDLCKSIITLSGYGVEFSRVLSQAFPEWTQLIANFHQTQYAQYREDYKFKKLYGFWKADRIDAECSARAWADTTRMIQETGILGAGNFGPLVAGNRDTIARLCAVLIDIMREKGAQVDAAAIQSMLNSGR